MKKDLITGFPTNPCVVSENIIVEKKKNRMEERPILDILDDDYDE
jgi:hypothetical protein